MKNTYISVSVQEGGKYYAYTLPVSGSDNLLAKLNIKGITHANICQTKKEAAQTAEQWNDSYKANGTYLFA